MRSVASQTIFLVWMSGVIAASPSPGDFSLYTWARAAWWPVYIAWVEVPRYFERIDTIRTPSEATEE